MWGRMASCGGFLKIDPLTKKLEARARVHQTIHRMKAEGKAFKLSAGEEVMLHSFVSFRQGCVVWPLCGRAQ